MNIAISQILKDVHKHQISVGSSAAIFVIQLYVT